MGPRALARPDPFLPALHRNWLGEPSSASQRGPRIVVGLPWKRGSVQLPDGQNHVKPRFHTTFHTEFCAVATAPEHLSPPHQRKGSDFHDILMFDPADDTHTLWRCEISLRSYEQYLSLPRHIPQTFSPASAPNWLSFAGLRSSSYFPLVLPQLLFSHQFSFYALGDDYHGHLRRFQLSVLGPRFEVGKEVQICTFATATASFDDPLLSTSGLEYPSSPTVGIQRAAAELSDGMSEGFTRTPSSGPADSGERKDGGNTWSPWDGTSKEDEVGEQFQGENAALIAVEPSPTLCAAPHAPFVCSLLAEDVAESLYATSGISRQVSAISQPQGGDVLSLSVSLAVRTRRETPVP
ncbi:hypothetical protein EI94DRAFT_1703688 [Lactarius quietus]|nr:hypothetical protein EI94DRAFT_1703688 [Lactarius quietus]